ncbi:MAG: EscU/YscU/HrcU family type III secretion system export apparatus switch protein [Planctomycetota bacterium]|nr:EscU/YscU/HrcU family type III secretion system export apparatus switch protein [Planctomycetota bacterium]
MAERSFPPTPKRLALAREAGLVAFSRALTAGALGIAALMGERILRDGAARVGSLAEHAWGLAGRIEDRDALAGAMRGVMSDGELIVAAVLWVLLAGLIVAAGTRLVQVGPRWALSPSHARAQLGLSGRETLLGGVVRGLVCIGGGVACVVWVLWASRGGLVMLVEASGPVAGAAIAGNALRRVVGWVAAGLVVFGVFDLVAARAVLRAKLWMTRDEVMREEREQQAPAQRGAVERDAGRQAAIVPGAAVVLRSGTAAAALAYRGEENEVPMIIATAFRAGAGRMCDLAVVSGVVVLDAEVELVMELTRLGAGALVPVAWYGRVGELLEVVRQQLEGAGREVPWGK